MATQKQVLSYTSKNMTSTPTVETVFTCPVGKIAKIEFNFANYKNNTDTQTGSSIQTNIMVVPAGTTTERPFAYLYPPTSTAYNAYTMFPTSFDKTQKYHNSTNIYNNFLILSALSSDIATNQTVTNNFTFPSEVYLNSEDKLQIKIAQGNGYPYQVYLNGLILIEDSDV